jgi:hypothetical protein
VDPQDLSFKKNIISEVQVRSKTENFKKIGRRQKLSKVQKIIYQTKLSLEREAREHLPSG